jgi:hypothetical protein
MRNALRPLGRFFCLLKWLAAVVAMATTIAAQTNGPTMTQVVDTVYRADGAVAKGTVLISWPAFTTMEGKAVAAGSISVQLGNGGTFAASLAPNTGAQPAGVYYKVIYQLSSQEPSTEYWVVPATDSTTIGSVRAKLQPQTIAAQVLTRDVADTNYVHVAGDQTIGGVKIFAAVPSVPAPVNASDVANKGYVDGVAGSVNLSAPGPIGAGTPNTGTFTALAASDLQARLNPWADVTHPAYGAKGDAQLAADCATTSGSQTLTCTGGSFAPSDVGKAVCASAAGTAGVAFCTIISGYTSASAITMAASAGHTAVGQSAYWGTNNDAAFSSALTTAQAAGVETIFIPTGKFLTVKGISVINNGESGSVPVRFLGTCPKRGGRAGAGTVNLQCSTVINGNNNTDAFLFTNTTRSGVEGVAVEGFGTGVLVHFTQGLSGTNQAFVQNSSGIGKDNFVRLDGVCGHMLITDNSAASQRSDSVAVAGSATGGCNQVVMERNWLTQAGRHGIYINPGGGAIENVAIRDNQIDLLTNGDGVNANIGGAGILENNDFESITGASHYAVNVGGYAVQFGPNFYYNNTRNLVVNTCYTCSVQNQFVSSGPSTDLAQASVWVVSGGGNTVFPPKTGMPLPLSDNNVTDLVFDTYGQLRPPLILSPNGNQATAGFLRLSSGDAVGWRNNANSGNLIFGKDASDRLTYNGNWFLDSSNNANVQNLTVNGTCIGCGGGSGSGDLASPPAIGSVTPNAGTFTTLTANSVNGTLNAAAFPGANPCAQINNALAALPATGGMVDASGFTAAQISGGCATTISIGVAAATLRFGAGTWKLGGNPGINVTAPKVTIECPKASEGDIYNTVAATLMSNGAYPLIADTVQSFHGTDGLTVRNCYMDGNGTGTFGLFLPYGSSGHLENVYTRNFAATGQFVLGGQWTTWAAGSGGNGGDGLVLGYDSSVEGNPQFAGNQGSAIHVLSGGNVLHGVGTYKNRLHGIYLDGRAVGDWTGQTAFVQQSFIRPATGNAGNFVYFTQTVGTTGSARPGFCQSPGCTINDGSVVWINAGTGYGYTPGSIFENAWWNFLESANSTSNGFQAPAGFDADDIRIEGTVGHPAFQNNISAAMVRQSEANDSPAHGIHLINTNYATISNVHWLGAGYSNNPDMGGLRFEGSKGNTVSNINCWFSYSNCIQLVSANNSTFTGLNVVNNGLAGTPAANTYAVSIDSGSVANTVNDLNVRDDRGPAYSRGVSDAGTQTIIANYRKSNLAANPDSFGTGYVEEVSTTGNPTYDIGPGQAFTWKSDGTQAAQLDALGNLTVGGELSVKDIPGHEYFVSKFANIQAAIDAAYNNGTVQGGATVIDDRLAPYSGVGFIVKDSVTLKLAATTYTITGTVTYNNGVGNVTAGIISMPGSHIVGVGTSSNHGTIVSAGAGLSADLIASSTLGTGTGANAQWWHWGSIESLNISGTSQASGRCLVVENMGETARVENILARSCYGNNIEIIGSSASQSSIRNITTMRSQTASGMRFTNLSGVGKVDGLSGDCNPTSLVSVQENAAGSLTILGLKAEGEASICTGQVHDPVVLLDGVSGFNDHVRIIGGYAFGTAQASFAKFVNAGNAILETEGLYITGYTNMLNDTVRGVTVPLSSGTSKQPFYYEPGGTTYANQAFTLTGGTFVQGQPATTPTEIFGLTTGSATLLAAAGNGDNSSILTGGIQISGQNRAQYGTPPEIMARWGYRWLGAGLGYDTTNFDLVPAWNSGDTSSRNLGNALTVCKKGSTAVSCRWPNIYALSVDTMSLTLNGSAVTIPTAGATTPNMDGTGAAGSSASFARADHVHPNDTSRVATASITAYGACGDSTHTCQVTTNAQGLVTNESAVAIAAGVTSIPYWSNQVAAGGAIAMSGTANKVYCYGVRIDQPITVTYVGMFVGTGDGTGNYSVQIFPPGSNQLPVFSSTAVHVSAAAGAEQQFSQAGNATWAATPGIYQLCTTGTAVTATMKGSASPMWNYYSQPSGLTSSAGLMSGMLTSTIAPTFLTTVPTVVMH